MITFIIKDSSHLRSNHLHINQSICLWWLKHLQNLDQNHGRQGGYHSWMYVVFAVSNLPTILLVESNFVETWEHGHCLIVIGHVTQTQNLKPKTKSHVSQNLHASRIKINRHFDSHHQFMEFGLSFLLSPCFHVIQTYQNLNQLMTTKNKSWS